MGVGGVVRLGTPVELGTIGTVPTRSFSYYITLYINTSENYINTLEN